ncbi:LLM class oxidoreductase [Krasilnikoviella flava]|uniref:Flavin-dependent oxidoreductase, luciferase family (Includes alkanesulfonate monooxygenase SsuD and methylene tetrahydromethanopterin reductase) n=1 Tax=Krasilnikoviella flava TaxID=526729 RepID=A0A1T5L751_9MICO|nr:LLM class flavin-dependent oxidoreductase [Krasilnikoviella flava]SKC71801.1 Flavin-dependent oxidoreductase, luciferase family (includes alkanesulfonate monooxygenase SsuD and methylene tetrahydromethanopterin reductase) [Krasilnikoviella flava]
MTDLTTPFLVGLDVDGAGAHPAAAAATGLTPAELVGAARLARSVRWAENAGVTFATFTDALLPAVPGSPDSARLDAVTRAAFVSRTTTAIGLVPQVATTYPEPFHVATQLASFDIAASGRGGWLATTTLTAETADAYGRDPVTDLAREARDVVQAVRDLWDSWEDDAVIRDVATGRYVDRDRLHHVDFVGETFSVKGPLITPRPPQGQLVVLAAAGAVAPSVREPLVDVTLVGGSDVATARAAARAATGPATEPATDTATGGAALAVLDLEVVLDTDGRTASTRLAELEAATPAGARTDWGGAALRYTGDAAGLAGLLAELAASGDVAGVRLLPAVLDLDLPVLARDVLPVLRAARLTAAPRAGATLRETLGLPRPANRYDARQRSGTSRTRPAALPATANA